MEVRLLYIIGKTYTRLYPEFQNCDLEFALQVASLAILALVRISVDILRVAICFPTKSLKVVLCYVSGLVALDRKTECYPNC